MLTCHDNITCDIIESNPDKPWQWVFICHNRNITMDFMKKHPEQSYKIVSCFNPVIYKNITWKMMAEIAKESYEWDTVCRAPDLTWKDIVDHPYYPWKWHTLSEHPNIKWETIEWNPDKEWCFGIAGSNPNITFDIIDSNKDIEWDYRFVSTNPNVTWENIEDKIEEDWDWDSLSGNEMKQYKESWIHDKRLKHIKALKIQRHWRNCSCNPEYKLAQRCLLRLHGT